MKEYNKMGNWERILTNREEEVGYLLIKGHLTHEMSKELCCTTSNIKKHRNNIRKKFKARTHMESAVNIKCYLEEGGLLTHLEKHFNL